MDTQKLQGRLTFIKQAEKLKDVLRSAHTSAGRHESTAEHTWRLCLMAMVFSAEFDNIDLAKLLQICIVHDLGEVISGDIPAIHQTDDHDKSARERADLLTFLEPLDPERKTHFLSLWEEYENASSLEVRLAKGLDKLETIIQHNQGDNPDGFDYIFNLAYGQKYMTSHPLLTAIRYLVDAETRQRAIASQSVTATEKPLNQPGSD